MKRKTIGRRKTFQIRCKTLNPTIVYATASIRTTDVPTEGFRNVRPPYGDVSFVTPLCVIIETCGGRDASEIIETYT